MKFRDPLNDFKPYPEAFRIPGLMDETAGLGVLSIFDLDTVFLLIGSAT
ncbi:hypothetical protein [Rhizobium bangladeshense]|nr:hypothetical protein [Rhizobium bangladeshense]